MEVFRLAWREIKIPALLFLTILIGGATGYKLFYPDISWFKLIYHTAITLSTVGYGDILGIEDYPLAAAYTIILIFFGMGMVLYSASTITAFIIEGRLGEVFKKKAIMDKINSMNNHFIVCGIGETGHYIIEEIAHSGRDLVIIDMSDDRVEALVKEFPKLCIIRGDATSDEILTEAGIQKAQGLIATLNDDKDNLFLTFTAKMLNPKIQIVAKSVDLSMTKKLENAGANYVVSPQFIGGMRMASVMLRPNVVTFLDKMLKGKDKSVRVGEFIIPKSSNLIGLKLGEAPIFEKAGINVFAYNTASDSEEMIYNPGPDTKLEEGGVLLFVGNTEQQLRLEKAFS